MGRLKKKLVKVAVLDENIWWYLSSFLPERDLRDRTLGAIMIRLSEGDGLAGVIDRWHFSLINPQRQPTVDRHNATQPVGGHSAHCDPVV